MQYEWKDHEDGRRRSRSANSTKIFVFATSSQKDEKKDEKKAEGIHKNIGCMLECLSLQHAQVIVLGGALKNKKWNNLKQGLLNRCHWSSNEGLSTFYPWGRLFDPPLIPIFDFTLFSIKYASVSWHILLKKVWNQKAAWGEGQIASPKVKMLIILHYSTNGNCLTTPVKFFCLSAPPTL